MEKIKIINIVPHPPAYDFYAETPPPPITWNIGENQWVGIWNNEWADLIGNEILKLTDEFVYEVWQPDPRADKIYSCTYANGLTHKLFPTKLHRKRVGIKMIEEIKSPVIYQRLWYEIKENPIILHLNDLGFRINQNIVNSIPNEVPVLVQFLGENNFSFLPLLKFRKDLVSQIYEWKNFYRIKRLLLRADAIGYCNYKTYNSLRRYFTGKMTFLPIGIDCDFWKSVYPRKIAKQFLGLNDARFILFTSARLISLKRIDRVIKILERLANNFDFQYIVAGIGEPNYVKYLFQIGENLIANGRLKFTGYLSDELLRTYYNAADLFVSPSATEGMPVTVLKALAMEVPVLSTKTGLLSDLLLRHNCGVVAPIETWADIFKKIFAGMEIRKLNRQIVVSLFNWPAIARRYIKLYRRLGEKEK
ncbi:MAG: glycosyltransferase family 4 protein [candidate division WOR-3 bacterium]